MRALCYAQALSGVGHAVRMRGIARGLAGAHEVHVVEGGRAVPHRSDLGVLHPIALPMLARVEGALVAVDGAADTCAVLAERARALAQAVERIRPDVVLIDHYPFSKWELDGEITAAIDTARAVNSQARIVSSLRDIAPQTRHERLERTAYEARVLALLRRFDAVFIHADPAFTRLEAHFARAADIPVPLHYTGFVVDAEPAESPLGGAEPYAVLSCGGGAGHGRFLLDAMEAVCQASTQGVLARMPVRVFAGAFFTDADLAALERAAAGGPFEIRRFAPDFAASLRHCALSIGRAGYNTCAALLQARVRAVLAPDPTMSDQPVRARRLEELGVATAVDGTGIAAMVVALRRAVERPAPQHRLSLDGVARTRALVEALAGE
jgi:predicted glycosyltransferase